MRGREPWMDYADADDPRWGLQERIDELSEAKPALMDEEWEAALADNSAERLVAIFQREGFDPAGAAAILVHHLDLLTIKDSIALMHAAHETDQDAAEAVVRAQHPALIAALRGRAEEMRKVARRIEALLPPAPPMG